MKISIYQKSVYRIILNATMVLRSIGKTYNKDTKKLRNFKIKLFEHLEKLIDLMERKKLINKNILDAIKSLALECKISIGQSQKSINVILKYHFYLNNCDKKIKMELDCPLDSIILAKVGFSYLKLNKIKLYDYRKIQEKIAGNLKTGECKIDFDKYWDMQNLTKDGLL